MFRTPRGEGAEVPRRLGQLTPTERRLWRAYPTGDPVDLRSGDADLDDPANADRWSAARTVRAEVIAALLLGAHPPVPGCVAAVRIVGARVAGPLAVSHGNVSSLLYLRRCRFDDPIDLAEAITGSIDLNGSRLVSLNGYGAQVRGTLDLRDAVVRGTDDQAINLDGITIDGDLYASGIDVIGPLNLINAQIGGQLTLRWAKLANRAADGKSLNAGGVHVGRSLMAQGLEAVGEVRLPGAKIGSALIFDGATLSNPAGNALTGDDLDVASDVFFRRLTQNGEQRFVARGTVRIVGAHIGGGLHLEGARLHPHAPKPGASKDPARTPALRASRITVDGAAYLGGDLTSDGELRLTGARIAGHLDLIGMNSPDVRLTLFAASVAGVRAELADWPDLVHLDHFTYGDLGRAQPVRDRLGLLRRQDGGYRSQPYEQLASYYRDLGQDADARAVLFAKQQVVRRMLPWPSRVRAYLLEILVGYGYRPLRALGWALGLLVAGSVYFAHVKPDHISSDDHSKFNPVLYTADQLIPVVRFGQSSVWQFHGFAAAVTVVLTVLGWTLGIAIAAAATRILTRN